MDRRRVSKPGSGRPFPPRGAATIDLDDAVYGVHAVEEALAAGERLRRIHIGQERARDPALRTVIERAREAAVLVKFEPPAFFATIPYKAHQSVVAVGQPFAYISLAEAVAARKPAGTLLVVLDHLTDPHNVGAILRTAECAGADAMVLPERRSAGINATVRKAAAGAAAHLPVAQVSNIAQALRTLKKAGIWIAGADAGEGAIPYVRADLARDLALVIGAEGSGLSAPVRAECDYLVSIPLAGKVPSLNASVAAGVLLYEVVRQRDSRA